jgi:N-acyl-L-homoserine lactone synthetase
MLCKVWPLYIEAQRAILSATQFVIEMNRFVQDPKAHAAPLQQMQELHIRTDGLVAFANARSHKAIVQDTDPEATAAQALVCMSVVKLNRSDRFRKRTAVLMWSLLTQWAVRGSRYTDIVLSPTCQFSPSHIVT